MEIFYCERCTLRVPNAEIASGQAVQRDGKLICPRCLPNEATRESRPEAPAETPATPHSKTSQVVTLAQQRGRAQKTPGTGRAAHKHSDPEGAVRGASHQEPRATAAAGSGGKQVVVLVSAAFAIGLSLLFFLSEGEKPGTGTAKPGDTWNKRVPTPEPAIATEPVRETPPATLAKAPGPDHADPRPVPLPRPDAGEEARVHAEKQAQAAFETLSRFEGVPVGDLAGRIQRIEAFLGTHGESIVAARARSLLKGLQEKAVPDPQTALTPGPDRTPPLPPTPANPVNPAVRPGPANPTPIPPAPRPAFRQGEGFLAEYFPSSELKGTPLTCIDKEILFNWGRQAPPQFRATADKHFSVRWSGWITPPEGGNYVFEIQNKFGFQLYLDDLFLGGAWGYRPPYKTPPLSLVKDRRYLLRLEARFTNLDRNVSLQWGLANGTLVPVWADPPAKDQPLVPGTMEQGFRATYRLHESKTPELIRKECGVGLTSCEGWLSPGFPFDRWQVRFEGYFVAPATDVYSFQVRHDTGARLTLGQLVLYEGLNLRGQEYVTGPIPLEKGKAYPLLFEYRKHERGDNYALQWQSRSEKGWQVLRPTLKDESSGVMPKIGFLEEYAPVGAADSRPVVTRYAHRFGWDWGEGALFEALPGADWVAQISGWITPPEDGAYTFEIDHDDGVLLLLDGVVLQNFFYRGGERGVTLPPLQLQGGKKYFLRARLRNRGRHARLNLRWRSDKMPRTFVYGEPPEAHDGATATTGRFNSGFLAEYFAKNRRKAAVKRREALAECHLGNESPLAGVPNDHFEVNWTAGLKVPKSGEYLFRLDLDETGELLLNRVSVLKLDKPGVKETQPLSLKAGQTMLFEVQLADIRFDAWLNLSWKPPGQENFSSIPPEHFLLPPEAQNLPREVPGAEGR